MARRRGDLKADMLSSLGKKPDEAIFTFGSNRMARIGGVESKSLLSCC